ncbi:MAG: hypothetical protein KAJ55_17555 [Anaerolineales bacterium]|nr:hypothetical protein [Anaerolineales bacterium]
MINKEFVVNSRKLKSVLIGVFICSVLNVGSDVTIGVIPIAGDVSNALFDTILSIIQLGLIAQFGKHGIEYIPD